MVYFLVEGYGYTRSKRNYFFRLLLFAGISQLPYDLAFSETDTLKFCGLNMLFTLCICFGILWVLEHGNNRWIKGVAVLALILLSSISDWAWLAPIFTLLFRWAGKNRTKEAIAFAVAALLFGGMNVLGGLGRFSLEENLLYAFLSMAGIGTSALGILLCYNGARGTRCRTFSKRFFYLFYPVHLLILGILRIFLQ
ncbi:MAG: TraX family protein [Ruminococcus callidus]